ncbi:hypothetical protein SAMN04488029_3572 [Reichenbachiella faecimaris]|uniref:Uncharacterized protein n=1 Tax=Reichenbachiella faecimaris TaxID=692418 RepID=A0A1W2GMT9_REIFA|nr:hypothetical protein SAMN04488029_3572 [Reichenbachiella faecimaris]
MSSFMIAVLVLFSTVFIARIINERALKTLDPEKKSNLIDLFSNFRIYSFGGMIVFLGIYYYIIANHLLPSTIAFSLYFLCVAIFLFFSAYFSRKILVKSNYPTSYINSYLISTVVKFAGFCSFFFLYMNR